jgi:cellulose 1,4-beta-cellobiosidase
VVRSTDAVTILAVATPVSLSLVDTAAPSVPTSVASSAATITSIGLSWAVSTDNLATTGYRIFRNGLQIGTSAATNFTDTGLVPNTAYSYSVAAVDAAGNVSAQSAAISARTLADTIAPSIPGLPASTTQTMTTISLSWTASTDNVGVAGYRVYRNGVQVATPTATNFTDGGLAPNTSYAYNVAAFDATNNTSGQSAAASFKTLADTAAPSVPVGLSGAVTGVNAALTWTAATDNVGVASYIVYRDGVQIATSTTANYTVVGALTGSHIYTVVAVDAAGNKSVASAGATIQIYVVGDINRDGKVDVFDLSILLANWSHTGVNTSDLNNDSVVNVFDLSVFLSHWTG